MYTEKNVENIVSALISGMVVTNETKNGWVIGYSFKTSSLDQNEKDLLNKTLVGTMEYDEVIHFVSDNNELPIYFDNEKVAMETIKQQMPHFEKRLCFSIFLETGIAYERPKNNVTFFQRKK